MSVEAEIDRLDERVTRLESHITTQLTGMDGRMGRIEAAITALSVQLAGKRDCPNPGACIELKPIVDDHTRQIINLRMWQSGMMAVILCLGFVVAPLFTILGPAIRVKLGLP